MGTGELLGKLDEMQGGVVIILVALWLGNRDNFLQGRPLGSSTDFFCYQ